MIRQLSFTTLIVLINVAPAIAVQDVPRRGLVEGHATQSASDCLSGERLTGDLFDCRRPWEESGLTFEATTMFDVSTRLAGRSPRANAVRNLFDLSVTADGDMFGLSEDSSLFLDYQLFSGQPGFGVAGDIQVYNNNEAERFSQISQGWYEHLLLDKKLKVRIGKADLNNEFAFVENGLLFIHSSMGVSPTLVSLPTYPDGSFGISAFLNPEGSWYAGFAIHDGALQRGITTGPRGPVLRDAFLITEFGKRWELAGDLKGRGALGAWHHTGRFDRFAGGRKNGTSGWYGLIDQQLYRPSGIDEDSERGLGWFLQVGTADEAVSPLRRHYGTGVQWVGPTESRPDDALGLGISAVDLTDVPAAGYLSDFETATEMFYHSHLSDWMSATLYVQHIDNPAENPTADDVWVGTLRVIVTF